jgi:hypothetical protein
MPACNPRLAPPRLTNVGPDHAPVRSRVRTTPWPPRPLTRKPALKVEYFTYENALPPQPIHLKIPGWAGGPEKMEEGVQSQPWHCLPFVEGCTYGLELLYPHETECRIINENWALRMEFDYRKEPGGKLTGGEFGFFAPRRAPKQYFFMPRIDIQPPPGYVVRIEPHPRYFTDTTGTVPTAMIAHLQMEWYPKLLFIVFRVPWPGQRHIFRKGEPFAQLLLVPHHLHYDMTPMSPVKAAERRELEKNIMTSRRTIATNPRQGADGNELDNHYKVLATAFARGGMAAVQENVQAACALQEQHLTADKTIPEFLALGAQLVNEK